MELKSALRLARLEKTITEAPGDDEEFEKLTPEEKLSNLGRRIFNITTQEPENRGNLHVSPSRAFEHTFRTKSGMSMGLKVVAWYTYPDGGTVPLGDEEIDPDAVFDVAAYWKPEGQHQTIERFSDYSLQDEHPEVAMHMLSRLNESVIEAEKVHTARQAKVAAR